MGQEKLVLTPLEEIQGIKWNKLGAQLMADAAPGDGLITDMDSSPKSLPHVEPMSKAFNVTGKPYFGRDIHNGGF